MVSLNTIFVRQPCMDREKKNKESLPYVGTERKLREIRQ